MAQPWAMREKLVDGKGNFGSVENDPPAAMRYTEARLTHLGAALMQDMEKDTVDFVPNYDERMTEPTVFPAAFPNLLVNGGTGIAVGMATNMAPHNLGEVIDGICAQIDNPDITIPGVDEIHQRPGLSDGRFILRRRGHQELFRDRQGQHQAARPHRRGGDEGQPRAARHHGDSVQRQPRRRSKNRSPNLVNEKVITEISAMRNESDEHCRLVIELKRDGNARRSSSPNFFSTRNWRFRSASTRWRLIMAGPKTLNLKQIIQCYIEHRREVILRRTRFELRKAEERAELLEGYLIALSNLDEFIHIIRSSKTRDEARVKLLAFEWSRAQVEKWGILIRSEARLDAGRYALTERQVDAILELRLYQLTGLEIDKVDSEYKALLEVIKDLLDILAKESRVMAIIKAELQAIKEKHATPRKTEIVPDEGEIAIEDLIANEGVIITLTHNGLIKRTNVSSYRAQRRGGKGVIGMTTQRRRDAG